MSAEKRALRLLGTRLSSIFNHEVGQEKRPESHQRPLSAPKLSNGQRKGDDILPNSNTKSQGSNQFQAAHDPSHDQFSSPPTPPSHAHNPNDGQNILLNSRGLQNVHLSPTRSPVLTQSPRTPRSRKPPPGDEAELDFQTASSPSLSRDAFADIKSLVGNELDQMMSSHEDNTELYVVTPSDEPTSPLHLKQEPENAQPQAYSHRSMSHLPLISSEKEEFEESYDPPLQHERVSAINDAERPLLYVKMPSSVYGTSSYYDSDRQGSPLSPDVQFSGSSRSATPQIFTALGTNENIDHLDSSSAKNTTNGKKNIHSMVNTNLHKIVDINSAHENADTPVSLPSPMRPTGHGETLWTDSIYSEALELPVDSFAESGFHSFAQSNFQTRGMFPNLETQGVQGSLLDQGSQIDSGSQFDFAPGSETTVTETLPQRNKLGLLQMWPNRTHSFSDTPNSSQMLTSGSIRKSHTRVSSTSSIISGSSRHVNLALIKRSFTLRPGEGERSNYVTTIRKSAGTSYNEAGPGKWKLPLGIMPMDSKNMALQSYTQNSARFSRGASSLNARSKRSSGVELKHGHLQPRLLAAEIDEVGDTNRFGSLGRSSTLQNKTLTPVLSTISKSENMSNQSAQSSQVSRSGSLTRSSTLSAHDNAGSDGVGGANSANGVGSYGFALAGSIVGGVESGLGVGGSGSGGVKSRRASGSSFAESLGSVADGRVDAYYQHQGYRYDDMDDNYHEFNEADSYDDDEGEDKPHLVLANPDSSSDNE